MCRKVAIISDNNYETQLQEAEFLIKARYFTQARRILDGLAAFQDPVAIEWLAKLDDLEKGRLSEPFLSYSGSSISDLQDQTKTYELLLETAAIFVQYGWTVKPQRNGRIFIEKDRAPSIWIAAPAILIFSLLGTIIVALVISAMGTEQILLEIADNKQVRVTRSNYTYAISQAPEAIPVAESVATGAGYGTVLVLWIIASVLWALILFIRVQLFLQSRF